LSEFYLKGGNMDTDEAINSVAAERAELEASVGKCWSTAELTEDFEVISFLAPYVAVIRRTDRAKGTMLFQHLPRFYLGFEEG
jgi:hypothetical protein